MRQAVVIFLLLIFLVVASVSAAFGQDNRSTSNDAAVNDAGASDPQFGRRRDAPDPAEQRMERERRKAAEKERQAAIKRDSDKLLALATELKQYVDKSNEHVLSLDVVRKAEEIEKLARQVKEKMKD